MPVFWRSGWRSWIGEGGCCRQRKQGKRSNGVQVHMKRLRVSNGSGGGCKAEVMEEVSSENIKLDRAGHLVSEYGN